MNLAAIEGRDTGVGDGLRRGPPQPMSRSSVAEKGGTFFQHTLQDGIVLWFEDFISQLLHHCGRYPEPKSVIVMDNASWHHSERILQMCVVLEFTVLA